MLSSSKDTKTICVKNVNVCTKCNTEKTIKSCKQRMSIKKMQFRKPERKRKLLGLCLQKREQTELSWLESTCLPNIIYVSIEGKKSSSGLELILPQRRQSKVKTAFQSNEGPVPSAGTDRKSFTEGITKTPSEI